MRRLLGLLSGLADSGFAAAGNLAMGLFAVRTLATDDLALYSLFFSGWVTAQLLPAQLSYLPARLAINAAKTIEAPRIAHDLRSGIVAILMAPLLVIFAGLPLISRTTPRDYAIVGGAAALLCVAAPFQDHVRRCLHVVGRHTSAAVCSAATFLSGTSILGVIYVAEESDGHRQLSAAITFGALAIANLLGSVVGVIALAGLSRGSYVFPSISVRLGYLGPDFVGQASGYLVSVITAGILGTTAVAALETARIMSSPVIVIVSGLSAYLIPNTVRLFVHAEPSRFKRRLLSMSGAVVSVGIAYSLVLVASGHRVAEALGQHADKFLGASRAIVATVDSASPGAAIILFTARRSMLWNAIAVGGSVVTLALLVPSVLVFGTFGVVLAQGVGAALKSGTGLLTAIRSTHAP